VFPFTATDARGRTITLERPPRRIVSLVPSQTELLADLGLDASVAGLTRFCVHPAGWKDRKAIVGGTKQVNRARIQALAPDLVLANVEENTREDIEALDTLAPVYVTDVRTLPDALAMMRTAGRLTGRIERAEALAAEIERGFARLPRFAPLRAVYLIWRRPYMAVGHDAFIHDVMTHGGFVNAFGDRSRYPEVTSEEIIAARPGCVLLSSEPYPFRDAHAEALRALLPGVPVLLVDGEPFSWYGSRLRTTPAYLQRLRDSLPAPR
jgi:ABC-type Fe3+-hydroxamate transport system substrate-binding protein